MQFHKKHACVFVCVKKNWFLCAWNFYLFCIVKQGLIWLIVEQCAIFKQFVCYSFIYLLKQNLILYYLLKLVLNFKV